MKKNKEKIYCRNCDYFYRRSFDCGCSYDISIDHVYKNRKNNCVFYYESDKPKSDNLNKKKSKKIYNDNKAKALRTFFDDAYKKNNKKISPSIKSKLEYEQKYSRYLEETIDFLIEDSNKNMKMIDEHLNHLGI